MQVSVTLIKHSTEDTKKLLTGDDSDRLSTDLSDETTDVEPDVPAADKSKSVSNTGVLDNECLTEPNLQHSEHNSESICELLSGVFGDLEAIAWRPSGIVIVTTNVIDCDSDKSSTELNGHDLIESSKMPSTEEDSSEQTSETSCSCYPSVDSTTSQSNIFHIADEMPLTETAKTLQNADIEDTKLIENVCMEISVNHSENCTQELASSKDIDTDDDFSCCPAAKIKWTYGKNKNSDKLSACSSGISEKLEQSAQNSAEADQHSGCKPEVNIEGCRHEPSSTEPGKVKLVYGNDKKQKTMYEDISDTEDEPVSQAYKIARSMSDWDDIGNPDSGISFKTAIDTAACVEGNGLSSEVFSNSFYNDKSLLNYTSHRDSVILETYSIPENSANQYYSSASGFHITSAPGDCQSVGGEQMFCQIAEPLDSVSYSEVLEKPQYDEGVPELSRAINSLAAEIGGPSYALEMCNVNYSPSASLKSAFNAYDLSKCDDGKWYQNQNGFPQYQECSFQPFLLPQQYNGYPCHNYNMPSTSNFLSHGFNHLPNYQNKLYYWHDSQPSFYNYTNFGQQAPAPTMHIDSMHYGYPASTHPSCSNYQKSFSSVSRGKSKESFNCNRKSPSYKLPYKPITEEISPIALINRPSLLMANDLEPCQEVVISQCPEEANIAVEDGGDLNFDIQKSATQNVCVQTSATSLEDQTDCVNISICDCDSDESLDENTRESSEGGKKSRKTHTECSSKHSEKKQSSYDNKEVLEIEQPWAHNMTELWQFNCSNFETEVNYNIRSSTKAPYCAVCSVLNYQKVTNNQNVKSNKNRIPRTSVPELPPSCFCDEDDLDPLSSALKPTKPRALLVCSKCKVCVHDTCYGVKFLPNGPENWICSRCVAGATDAECALCCLRGGALKAATKGKWVHLVCAIGNSEVSLKNINQREPVDLSKISNRRATLKCSFCGVHSFKNGKDRYGKCVQCSVGQCNKSFHVTCARAAGLDITTGIWPYRLFITCLRHSSNSLSKRTEVNDRNEIKIGEEVYAKHKNGRYYLGEVVNIKNELFYCVIFDDNSTSRDLYPSDIINFQVSDGAPALGSYVHVKWPDGLIYYGHFQGTRTVLIYSVEFEDSSVVQVERDMVFPINEQLPPYVQKKLSYASEMKNDVFYRKDNELITDKRTRGVQMNYNHRWDI